jgi:hypothetical protein
MTDRTVVRLEKDGTRTLLADRYDWKRFNGPNAVEIKSDGAIYFTDSVFWMRGGAESPARELPCNGFFLVKNGRRPFLAAIRITRAMLRMALRCHRMRRFSMSRRGSGKPFAMTLCPTIRWRTAASSSPPATTG